MLWNKQFLEAHRNLRARFSLLCPTNNVFTLSGTPNVLSTYYLNIPISHVLFIVAFGMAAVARPEPEEEDVVLENTGKNDGEFKLKSCSDTTVAGVAADAKHQPVEGNVEPENTTNNDGPAQVISNSNTTVAGVAADAKHQPVEGNVEPENTANNDGAAQVTSSSYTTVA